MSACIIYLHDSARLCTKIATSTAVVQDSITCAALLPNLDSAFIRIPRKVEMLHRHYSGVARLRGAHKADKAAELIEKLFGKKTG